MRKYKIVIHQKKEQIIFATDKDSALKIAKTNLGFKETDVLISNIKEFFTNIEDLIARCEVTKNHFNGKAIEIVELWEPLEMIFSYFEWVYIEHVTCNIVSHFQVVIGCVVFQVSFRKDNDFFLVL